MNKFEFPVTIYGNLEKYNDVTSKARCRIFYKYGNRNGTYITDEFAEKISQAILTAVVTGNGTTAPKGALTGATDINTAVSATDLTERSYRDWET